jgi:hypothetical protein
MQVSAMPKGPGTHRVEYHVRLHGWAFPLFIGVNTSYYPTEESGLDVSQWQVQRVLVVHVLCMRMEVVIAGPRFDDPDPEEEP